MLDPMITLPFSVYSGKGMHALLLGSGVSHSSGIPTGWDIVLDLIRKVAAIKGMDCGEAPDAWYRENYQKEPDYADLLEMTQRRQTFRRGFDERGFGDFQFQPLRRQARCFEAVQHGCREVRFANAPRPP